MIVLAQPFPAIAAGLRFWAERTPDAQAVRAIDGRCLSHRELHGAIAGIARRLAALGVRHEDRVALILPNGFEAALALLGTMTVAAVVPLNAQSPAGELTRDLRRLRTRLVVTGGSAAAIGRDTAAELGIAAVAVEELVGDLAPDAGELPLAATNADPEGVAAILHTSGTTDLPKRVLLPQRAFLAGAALAGQRLRLTSQDVLLATAGLHTITGPGNILTAVLNGGSCVITPGFDLEWLPDWLARHRPTWLVVTPAELGLLLEAMERTGIEAIPPPGERARRIFAGGQAMPPGLAARAGRRLGALVLPRYGMTEATYIAWPDPECDDRPDHACGRPLAAQVRILDAAGNELPPDAWGEVVIRGPTLFSGYLDDPEANAAAFLPDGWFRTGDFGVLDADGFLSLTGRAKELINRGGEKIAPVEVDHALLTHPAVAEAAVFGIPDPWLGEDIVAAVVLKPGAAATPRDLRRWMLDRLSRYKAPHRIWFVAALPRTATGKVQRNELARRWAGEHS